MLDLFTTGTTLPNTSAPLKGKRSRLQVVVSAEDSWLAPYIIPVDIYICPTEVLKARYYK